MSFCVSTGNRTCNLALIGEAPGYQELQRNPPIPFVGASGQLLWTISQYNNIYRTDTYCTNVIKTSAPSNPLRSIPSAELDKWKSAIRNELNATQCNLYVALGNTALWAIASDDISQTITDPDPDRRTSISDWRGSMLQTFNGRKLIPTLHPANILRQPSMLYLFERDMKLIGSESTYPDLKLPQCNYLTHPSLSDALDYIKQCSLAGEFAFDIETAGAVITCVSFAYKEGEAMSIPMQGLRYWSGEQFVILLQAISKLFARDDVLKIGQNVSYDITGFRNFGIIVYPPIYDIMHMYHAIDPGVVNDSATRTVLHSLASQASRFTRHPFWKAWDVVPKQFAGASQGQGSNLFTYNCKDSIVTLELKHYYDKMPATTQQLYTNHYQKVQPHLIQMYEDGLCVDKPLQWKLASQFYQEAEQLETQICKALNAKKGNLNSSKQLATLLYDTIGLPVQYAGRGSERRRTVDDNALIRLYLETQNPVILRIRDAKEKQKLASFMLPKSKDAQNKRKSWDGRLRCEYKLNTGTGRLSSSASIASGTGINLQNIPHIVRQTIVPAPGYIFLEPDMMQAEARVIVYDSLDYKYIQLFQDPDNFDMHWYNAEIVLQRPRDAMSEIDRDISKHVVYGSYYGMAEYKLQETILRYASPPEGMTLDDYYLSLEECKRRQRNFTDAVPTFLARQERIRKEVLSTGQQVSPTGQIVTYHEIITDKQLAKCFGRRDYSEVFRSAYSMIPQNVVAKMINQALVRIDTALRRRKIGRVAAQVHDSLLNEILDDEQSLVEAFRICKGAIEAPFMIRGNAMNIPADFKLGYHWMGEVKKIRTEEQLVAAYKRIKR